MMRAQTPPHTAGNVVVLSRRSAPAQRAWGEILAAQRAERARHAAAMDALDAELAGAPSRVEPAAERTLDIKRAAAEVNWSETTLRRNIIRYHKDHPDRIRWAIQFGGKKKARWSIYINRLKVVIASGEPFEE